MIRLAAPDITEAEVDAVAKVLRSGFLVQGENVARFEQALIRATETPEAVAVNSGTSALLLALMALEIGPGDQVAVTAYSWPATANVIELVGARPIFVDIDPLTYNIDPEKLRATLVQNAAIKAVLLVHAFGGMSNLDELARLCDQFKIPLIEDAACALGAKYDGRPAGQWGTLACFSFHPRKAITTGEGGAVVGQSPQIMRKLRQLRNHGIDPIAARPDFVVPGHNFRLTEMQAALGLVQLGRMPEILKIRQIQAARYNALLAGTMVHPPKVDPRAQHVFQSYVVSVPARRDEIIATLKDRGIETTIGTQHIPLTTYYRRKYDFRLGDFPGCDHAAAHALTLPLHSSLTPDQQKMVVHTLIGAVNG